MARTSTVSTVKWARKDWREITLERMEKLAEDPRLSWSERAAFGTAMGGLDAILREERGTVAEPEPPRW